MCGKGKGECTLHELSAENDKRKSKMTEVGETGEETAGIWTKMEACEKYGFTNGRSTRVEWKESEYCM